MNNSSVNDAKESIEDPLYEQAVDVVLAAQNASISLVRNRLGISYIRSLQMIERMEKEGIVSNTSNSPTRQVLQPRGMGDSLKEEDQYRQAFCKEMVEKSWRSFLTFAAEGSEQLAVACIARLEERSEEIARSLDLATGKRFLSTIDAERRKIFDEYSNDPVALKARLGVPINNNKQIPERPRSSSRNELGNLVVRTAVRATVWESIIGLFRFLR
jgi:hypothetical protein